MSANSVLAAPRFALIDALRGIAASWVVLYHASEGGHVAGIKSNLPASITHVVFDMGHYGVAIFFALSGFVIAHSIRGAEVTSSYIGRFALRRSIRLDPPYWISIGVVVTLAFLSASVKKELFVPPTGSQLLAHIFYLQTLLGFPQINWVYWTLTYEVQFYLALVFAASISQRLRLPIIGVASVPLLLTLPQLFGYARVEGLFTNLWHAFLIGAFTYWARGSARARLALFGLAAGSVLVDGSTFALIAVATALLIYVAGEKVETALHWGWLQFLGAISYSLYLIHNPVSGAVFFICRRVGVSEVVGLMAAFAMSVAAAWILWLAVEEPSKRLSRKINLKSKAQSGDAD